MSDKPAVVAQQVVPLARAFRTPAPCERPRSRPVAEGRVELQPFGNRTEKVAWVVWARVFEPDAAHLKDPTVWTRLAEIKVEFSGRGFKRRLAEAKEKAVTILLAHEGVPPEQW